MHPNEAVTAWLYARDYSPKTREWYDLQMRVFVDFCTQQGITDCSDITKDIVVPYLRFVGQRMNPQKGTLVSSHTVHAYARALKAFLNWAADRGLVDVKVTHKLPMPKREGKVIAVFTPLHIDRLLRAASMSTHPERDKTIISVLLDTGIRANELCTLTMPNVHFDRDDAWLQVHGKGDKWRVVGLGRQARNTLHWYIHRHRHAPDSPLVFLGDRGQLTPNGLDQMLYRLRDAAGASSFNGVRVSAHTFRHTYAYNYIKAGGNIFQLSILMGHTELKVTMEYLKAFTAHDARKGLSVLDTMVGRR